MNIDREIIENLIDKTTIHYTLNDGMKEALHRDDVETHFENGGEIEFSIRGNLGWGGVHPLVGELNWDDYDYRIKERTMADRRDELIEDLADPRPSTSDKVLEFLKDLEL